MEKDPIKTDKIKRKVQFSEVVETFTTYNGEVGKSSRIAEYFILSPTL